MHYKVLQVNLARNTTRNRMTQLSGPKLGPRSDMDASEDFLNKRTYSLFLLSSLQRCIEKISLSTNLEVISQGTIKSSYWCRGDSSNHKELEAGQCLLGCKLELAPVPGLSDGPQTSSAVDVLHDMVGFAAGSTNSLAFLHLYDSLPLSWETVKWRIHECISHCSGFRGISFGAGIRD